MSVHLPRFFPEGNVIPEFTQLFLAGSFLFGPLPIMIKAP